MKIVTIARCYNEPTEIIERFLQCYWFSDKIIISDGGSNNGAYELLKALEVKGIRDGYPKLEVIQFKEQKTVNGELWNDDNPHIQYVLDAGKNAGADWLILDDMDDVPNYYLRQDARHIFESCGFNQVNAFRLYMWGNEEFFPLMNNNFDIAYTSLWAWRPDRVNIQADITQHHGTIVGVEPIHYNVEPPYCLLHKSWNPETIDAKIKRYTAVGIQMSHPLAFAGQPQKLPDYADEYSPDERTQI